jgi:hypothetical protein
VVEVEIAFVNYGSIAPALQELLSMAIALKSCLHSF